jgi:DNA-binding PadR family transcriptional regulator
MKSPVNWALLGLIIQRQGYAFELARRFEHTYRDVLPLSSTSHVYTALGVLEGRALVEQIPDTRTGRQPKPRYRATTHGIEGYAAWLAGYVDEERRRQILFVLGLSALASKPHRLTGILDRLEQGWLAPENVTTSFVADGAFDDPVGKLVARILTEENQLTVAARLSWVRNARQAINELAGETVPE